MFYKYIWQKDLFQFCDNLNLFSASLIKAVTLFLFVLYFSWFSVEGFFIQFSNNVLLLVIAFLFLLVIQSLVDSLIGFSFSGACLSLHSLTDLIIDSNCFSGGAFSDIVLSLWFSRNKKFKVFSFLIFLRSRIITFGRNDSLVLWYFNGIFPIIV